VNWNSGRDMVAGGLIVGLIVVGLASCSATKADAPEPSPSDIKSGTHTRVIQMPNGFRNVAATCQGSTGVYVTSRGVAEADPQPSGIAVLANDPACAR
jgi:hypothetical protein